MMNFLKNDYQTPNISLSKKRFAMVTVLFFLIMGGVWALCMFVIFSATALADTVIGLLMLTMFIVISVKNYRKWVIK
jgi:uncharacterized membrane protein YccF (DUF307 family)